MPVLYKDYFNIDPKYYAAVTADLIEQGKVSWKGYYPHDSFVKLLQTTYRVLSGQEAHSIWVQGAYGTGKSHAALTIKSILDASEEEVIAYFDDFGLSRDLRDKYVSLKANSNILTIHRIGSAGINTDLDLILAVQQSIMTALKAKGIENHGDASMKDAFLKWISKKANRNYFADLITDEQYAWDFSGVSVEEIIERLQSGTTRQIEQTMSKVMKVLKDNGQYGIFSDINQMAGWIRSVIKENNLSAILFVWDEFSEYFLNHPVGLTGFQTLAEISENDPFYFMIVAHQSTALFADKDTAQKVINRFGGLKGPVEIKLPENMAFRLMAQAMKKTDDPVLSQKWVKYAGSLNSELTSARYILSTAFKKQNKLGQKTLLSDSEMQAIVPMHPYAALVLKHISALYNARSMFEFIIDGDENDGIAFKSFINHYGPFSDPNLLTVDMLWNFFTSKGEIGLDDDVRGVLSNYSSLQGSQLLPDEQRVLKTLLLLQAVSLRVDEALLAPNDENLELSFMGTDWNKGKSLAVAKGLIDKGILFKKPVAGGGTEYCVVSVNSGGDIAKIREVVISETHTQGLIVAAELKNAVTFPAAVKARYISTETGFGGFISALNTMKNEHRPQRFKVIITFAMDDDEARQIRQQIIKQVNTPSNDIVFIETLTPMGKDLFGQYIENMTFSRYNTKKDGTQAKHYEQQATAVLTTWKNNITSGAFNIYTPTHKVVERKATLTDLQDALTEMNHKKYYYGLEQYTLNATMYNVYQLANGAGYGISESLSGAYDNKSNKKMSFENALQGAWKVPKYWEDPAKQSLVIVHVKNKVDELVKAGFDSPAGRVSILSIVEELEKEPFGLMPSSLSALVLGFVLKEYCSGDYFWSNGSNNETMTMVKMKTSIANALNQKITPTSKYKEEYIVAMSPEVRRFLLCTSNVFHTPQLGSVENARNNIRIRMKEFIFPIWCVKYILNDMNLESSVELVERVIDDYTGIANTANTGNISESELADDIGSIVMKNAAVESDMERLFTNEQCRKGMLAYIAQYHGGVLKQLAEQIGDGGNYLDEVKSKFNAVDANWVWNTSTADEKISDVILEYQIIVESNKSIGNYTTLKEVVTAWNNRTNQIRIPCEVVAKSTGDLGPFLWQLCYMKQSNGLSEQNKQIFLDLLMTQRKAFDVFYKNQLPYFEQDADAFLGELNAEERAELYASFPSGQFTKGKTEYYKFVQTEVNKYMQSRIQKQLRDKWFEKTHTKTPDAWCEKYETPLLCMFDDSQRTDARTMLRIVRSSNPSESDAKKALAWLDAADFYERLEDEAERDTCFMKRIVGSNAILLKDISKVRNALISSVHDRIYDWMDNSSVQNQLKKMTEKQYKLSGCDQALAVIEKMDADQLRKYLRERIQDDADFGLQILKGE